MKANDKMLKDILKGELSATETYEQVIDSVGDDPRVDPLRRMHSDHEMAVAELRRHMSSGEEVTVEGSGAWGAWARAVTGTAKVFGDTAALKALKEGEEHGLKQYQRALDEEIDLGLKNVIRSDFIPRQREHIRTLDTLIERMAS